MSFELSIQSHQSIKKNDIFTLQYSKNQFS